MQCLSVAIEGLFESPLRTYVNGGGLSGGIKKAQRDRKDRPLGPPGGV